MPNFFVCCCSKGVTDISLLVREIAAGFVLI